MLAPGRQDPAAAPACDNLRTLALNASLEENALQSAPSAAWIKFSVQAGARYRLAVSNATGLQLAVHDQCDANAPAAGLVNGQIEFTATRSGDYYLLLQRLAGAAVSGYQVTLKSAAPPRPSMIALADVPQEALRRAIDFLEELRNGQLAPQWDATARVNPTARILYRPDMTTPAYYEFTVEKPDTTGKYVPAGFIQVAAGSHDYPIAHWDATGMSPTQQLQELAPLGVQLTEFYKVDALSYAAEYQVPAANGLIVMATDVVNLGSLPGRIEGLSALPAQPAELVTESIDSNGTTTHEGPAELPLLNQQDWDSWAALKAGYKAEYAPLLASQQQRASQTWNLENQRNLYGETLVKGDVRSVYGLPAQTIQSISVTGAGAAAQYLAQQQLTDGATITGIKLTVLAEPPGTHDLLPFQVGLQYTGGMTETVKYAIANSAGLVNNRIFLPMLIGRPKGTLAGAAEPAGPAAPSGDWGPWTYWWATGDMGSFTYGQIPAHTRVNTSGCASGCGATAWAMVFGWVDRRAGAGTAPWTNHWGIYRQNGGLGANVVAPLFQDAGVENMTWEIRNDIGTWCIFGSGATWPWNMINAANYVRPRATAAWRMSTRYDPTGLCWFGACNGARNLAIDAVTARHQPAVVGTGWLKHYPVAYGYAERSRRSCFLWICSTEVSRWFYVNNGWYGSDNGWASADVWFGGAYYPN